MLPGKGTVVYKNNDKYEGDWANDLRHGLGTLWIYKGGKYIVRYNGEWRDDQPTVSGFGSVSGPQCLYMMLEVDASSKDQTPFVTRALVNIMLPAAPPRATGHFLKTMATLMKATGSTGKSMGRAVACMAAGLWTASEATCTREGLRTMSSKDFSNWDALGDLVVMNGGGHQVTDPVFSCTFTLPRVHQARCWNHDVRKWGHL